MKSKFAQIYEGVWVRWNPQERWACCDCELIHTVAFAVEANGNLGIAVRRENRRTAAHRRAAKFRGLKLPKKEANK